MGNRVEGNPPSREICLRGDLRWRRRICACIPYSHLARGRGRVVVVFVIKLGSEEGPATGTANAAREAVDEDEKED